MDINKVTLLGRVTQKPVAREVPSGQKMATFSVATSYVWKHYKTKEKKDKTEHHPVIVWGKLADMALAFLDAGARIYLEGRLQRGASRSANTQKVPCDIIADEIILLGHKKDEDESLVEEV